MWLKFVLGLLLAYLYFFVFNDKQDGPARKEKTCSTCQGSGGGGNRIDSKWLIPPNVEVPQPPSMSTLHVYSDAAVCSDKSVCSNIGKMLLQQGGNAIDAVIGSLLCNGLVTMQSMGIGGGVIMTYYERKTQKSYSIMGRERAPYKLKEELLKEFESSETLAQSPLAIAVPGEVAGYYEAHKRFGSLPWHYIIQPTAELCEEGYTLTRHQRDALFLNEQRVRKDSLLRSMFVNPANQQFYREGSHIQIPQVLCSTYKVLMDEGPSTFYNGTLASMIVEDLNDMGSPITVEDLSDYKVDIRESIKIEMDAFYLHVPSPPASGHIVAFVMQILQHFKDSFVHLPDFRALDVHRIVEALKYGFVKRWEYDSEMSEEDISKLLSLEYAKNISQSIYDQKTFDDPFHYGASKDLVNTPDYGTAQIAVLGPNGDAVSATSSINYYFGCGRMGSRTGILFNNAMSDFTVEGLRNYFNLPNVPNRNRIKAHIQPMSSMAPLIVTHKESGEVRLVTGAAGGSRIISSLVQILIRTLWMDKNIKQAIDFARFHHQLVPNTLEYEFGILQEIVEELERRGHATERVRHKNTAVCGVEKVRGAVLANVDYRKEGGVDGF
ncbi:scoloptoxin SSD14 [Musca autumnalis]|uniref:scoloptoxin SSD14 n=1 Tax=Musca autumnalis TaxID=221902 RepID=UPI003CF05FAA